MPRQLQKLTAAKIKRLNSPGLYPDGQSLYIRVKSPTSKSWVFRYMRNNRPRMMGLGSADTVTLAEARDLAIEQRRLLARDIDPIDHRKAQRRRSDVPTFAEAAERYISAQSQGWKSAKHEQQWRSTLNSYAHPVIGTVAVDEIHTEHIRRILDKIWYSKPETASRVRGRIEAVLSWSKALDLRSGENPALWRGHLDQIYPARSRFKPLRHQKMLSWRETPEFYRLLANSDLIGSRPLMFAILTAARRNDIVSAMWGQMDLSAEIPVWTVAASALKGHKRDDHRVPLSAAAVSILNDLSSKSNRDGDFVFRGRAPRRPISGETMRTAISRLGRGGEFTQHGFRRTFRSWAAEQTTFPREVVEAALAHENPNKVEAAYLASDFFEKRQPLMQAWADFITGKDAGAVVAFRNRA